MAQIKIMADLMRDHVHMLLILSAQFTSNVRSTSASQAGPRTEFTGANSGNVIVGVVSVVGQVVDYLAEVRREIPRSEVRAPPRWR